MTFFSQYIYLFTFFGRWSIIIIYFFIHIIYSVFYTYTPFSIHILCYLYIYSVTYLFFVPFIYTYFYIFTFYIFFVIYYSLFNFFYTMVMDLYMYGLLIYTLGIHFIYILLLGFWYCRSSLLGNTIYISILELPIWLARYLTWNTCSRLEACYIRIGYRVTCLVG